MLLMEVSMDIEKEIQSAGSDAQELEKLYQSAQESGQAGIFQAAITACHGAEPDNLLYAAWYYRFQKIEDSGEISRRVINWSLAIVLSVLTGLIFWILSDFDTFTYLDTLPVLVFLWSPIATISALIFLAVTARNNRNRAVALGLGVLATAAYVLLVAPGMGAGWQQDQYLILAAIHIPLVCWGALGVMVLGFRSSREERFAFLIKSIEVMITAGLYLIAGVVLGLITVGLFAALSIKLPDIWMRLIAAGGLGLLPVLAVASVYDPTVSPSEQDFDQGLSRFISTMMRLLLPLTLGILIIYLFVIPFNFTQPYTNRDVLIVYNAMLFAIIGLLVGATPVRVDDLSPDLQKWLRSGILIVAILAVLISLYALSAVVYRTIDGGLTINRVMIIGWNVINISILLWLVIRQFMDGRRDWIGSLHSVFKLASSVYLVWGLLLLVVIPWVFR